MDEVHKRLRTYPIFVKDLPQDLLDRLDLEPGRIEAMPTGLIWTTEKPTQPGWYWFRKKGKAPRIAEVDSYGDVMFMHMLDDGEWAGPLEPPQ